MRKNSKSVLLDYLKLREQHALRNKLSVMIGKDIYKYCNTEGWNIKIADRIVRMLSRQYVFMRRIGY